MIIIADIDGTLVESLFKNTNQDQSEMTPEDRFRTAGFTQKIAELDPFSSAVKVLKDSAPKLLYLVTGRKCSQFQDATTKMIEKMQILSIVHYYPEECEYFTEQYVDWKVKIVRAIAEKHPCDSIVTFEDDEGVWKAFKKRLKGILHFLVWGDPEEWWSKLDNNLNGSGIKIQAKWSR